MKTPSFLFLFMFLSGLQAFAAPEPFNLKDRHDAGQSKTGQYISSGFFLGGDRAVTSTRLKDVRRGPQAGGVERVVLDFEGAVKAPFFQINVSSHENRLVVSIWADVHYEYNADKLHRAFAKSTHVKKVNILPRVEDGVSTIELALNESHKQPVKVEAFYLAHPARIILDLQ